MNVSPEIQFQAVSTVESTVFMSDSRPVHGKGKCAHCRVSIVCSLCLLRVGASGWYVLPLGAFALLHCTVRVVCYVLGLA